MPLPERGRGALGSREVAPFVCLPRPLRASFLSLLRPSPHPLPLLLTFSPGPSGARSRPCFVWTRGEEGRGLPWSRALRPSATAPASATALRLAECSRMLRGQWALRSAAALPFTPVFRAGSKDAGGSDWLQRARPPGSSPLPPPLRSSQWLTFHHTETIRKNPCG